MANVFDEYLGVESSATPPPTTGKGNVFDDYLGTTPVMPTPVAPQKTPGFLDRVSAKLSERGGKLYEDTGGSMWSDKKGTMTEKNLSAVGHLVGGVGDVATEGIKSLYSTLATEEAQSRLKSGAEKIGKDINSLMQTQVGREGIRAFKIAGGAWDLFKEEHPDIAHSIAMNAETAWNIGSNVFGLGLGRKTGQLAAEAGKEVGSVLGGDIKAVGSELSSAYKDLKVAGKNTTGIDTAINKTVEKELPKILKPSNKNLARELTESSDYYKKATPAFEDVVMNKNVADEAGKSFHGFVDAKGKPTQLPQTVADHVSAIDVGEKKWWDEVVRLREAAGKEGANIPPKDINNMIAGFKKAKERNLASSVPDANANPYIDEVINSLSQYSEKGMPLSIAQRDLSILNDKIYTKGPVNPGYTYGAKESDIYHASKLKESMNDVIEKFNGNDEFKKAKAMYGSYKVTKEDAIKRANQIARTPEYSLFDMPDMYMAYHGGYGLLTGNPATIVATLGAAGAKKYEKMMISPDKQMKKLYEHIDQLVDQKRRIISPQSEIGKGVSYLKQSMDAKTAKELEPLYKTKSVESYKQQGESATQSLGENLKGLMPSDVALRKAGIEERASSNLPAVQNTKPVPSGAPVKSYQNWEDVPLESQQPRNYPRLPDTQKQLPAPNPHRTIGDFIKEYEVASPQGKIDMIKSLSGEDRKWIPFIKSGNYKKARGRL